MEASLILLSYFIVMMLATYMLTQKRETLTNFAVADRNMGTLKSAMSIAATWIWAPALFVSAEKAYSNGWVGLFWFLVPNVLCLMFFIPFAKKIREQMPEGVTLAGYIYDKYKSKELKNVYLAQLGLLTVLSTAVQLLAGGKILCTILGIGFVPTMLILCAIAFSYSQFSGIEASVMTDAVQMIMILGVCALLVPWALTMEGGTTALMNGLAGINHNFTSLINDNGILLFFSFGLPTALGLMAGPFGDQCFWQRAFSIRKDKIGKAFFFGALMFAVVPLSMGILGFIAAGSGFVDDKSVINYKLVAQMFPAWVEIPFLFMIISGLLSTIDSNLCAVSSLVGEIKENATLKDGKIAMMCLLALGVCVASVPQMTVTYLFLIYGTLRSTTMLPTIFTLCDKKLNASKLAIGIIMALVIAIPVFTYGTFQNSAIIKTIGCLLATLTGVTTAKLLSKEGE